MFVVLKTLKLNNVTLDSLCKACKKTNTKVVEKETLETKEAWPQASSKNEKEVQR